MGENGGKRHLRPVNSADSPRLFSGANGSGSSTLDTGKEDKLRRAPFASINYTGKDAEKKRQHGTTPAMEIASPNSNCPLFLELLMEEFRIAHRRMFGAKSGGAGGIESSSRPEETPSSNDAENEKENLGKGAKTSQPDKSTTNSTARIRPPVQPPPRLTLKSAAPPAPSPPKNSPETTTTAASSELSSSAAVADKILARQQRKTCDSVMENTDRHPYTVATSPSNRITIKVLSPKLAS